jgi:DNA-binding MarR family transcriptional regulator
MKRLVLNSGEAAILTAFGRDTVVSIPEIAVSAKMTPSQVREGVAHLYSKRLVHPLDSNHNLDLVKLTTSGSAAKQNLINAPGTVFIAD